MATDNRMTAQMCSTDSSDKTMTNVLNIFVDSFNYIFGFVSPKRRVTSVRIIYILNK